MNGKDSKSVGPMLKPPHLGELIRESMEASHWNVDRDSGPLGVRAWDVVASAQWEGRWVRKYGAGVGRNRVGNR